MHVSLLITVQLCFVSLFVTTCGGLLGVDLSRPMVVSDWQSLLSTQTVDFAVVRLVFENGSMDFTGIRSLRAAAQAGITDLSGYIYPCIQSSSYVQSNGIQCLSPLRQVEQLIHELKVNKMKLANYTRESQAPTGRPTASPSEYHLSSHPTGQPTGSPTGQPTDRPTKTPISANSPSCAPTPHPTMSPTPKPTSTHHPTSSPTVARSEPRVLIKRLFLMIEDETPSIYFDVSSEVNVKYMMQMAHAAWLNYIDLGVYTTLFDWSNIMIGPETSNTSFPFHRFALWLPRYDGIASMDFFAPFGGFTSVFMKRYSGGSQDAERAGTTRINLNYIHSETQNITTTIAAA